MNSFFSDIVNEYELDKPSFINVAAFMKSPVCLKLQLPLKLILHCMLLVHPTHFYFFCNRTIKERN